MPYVTMRASVSIIRLEGEKQTTGTRHGGIDSIESWHESGYVDALKAAYQLILIDARVMLSATSRTIPNAQARDWWSMHVPPCPTATPSQGPLLLIRGLASGSASPNIFLSVARP